MNEMVCFAGDGLGRVLIANVSAADMAAIARALVEKAKQGNISAIRMVLSYVVGKPGATKAERKEKQAAKPAMESETTQRKNDGVAEVSVTGTPGESGMAMRPEERNGGASRNLGLGSKASGDGGKLVVGVERNDGLRVVAVGGRSGGSGKGEWGRSEDDAERRGSAFPRGAWERGIWVFCG